MAVLVDSNSPIPYRCAKNLTGVSTGRLFCLDKFQLGMPSDAELSVQICKMTTLLLCDLVACELVLLASVSIISDPSDDVRGNEGIQEYGTGSKSEERSGMFSWHTRI